MIKKMWVKFDGMDVECICDEHHRKCDKDECGEYVVKFTEIERTVVDEVNDFAKSLNKEIFRLNTEIKKNINKFKI